MKARHEELLKDAEHVPGVHMGLLDPVNGYGYTPEKGLWKLRLYQPDENGIVALDGGRRVPLSSDVARAAGMRPFAGYQPYRRVKSDYGYRKTEGDIQLPTAANLAGVDEKGEAAYNHFGLDAYNKRLARGDRR